MRTTFIIGFQIHADGERLLDDLRERLRKFGLELHGDKTRLIEFGRFAAEERKHRGKGKSHLGSDATPPAVATSTTYHPSSSQRATVRQHLRQEPDAVVPHVRTCAGGAGQPASLPRRKRRSAYDFDPLKVVARSALDARLSTRIGAQHGCP
jgi:hypothetical protein